MIFYYISLKVGGSILELPFARSFSKSVREQKTKTCMHEYCVLRSTTKNKLGAQTPQRLPETTSVGNSIEKTFAVENSLVEMLFPGNSLQM